MVIFQDRQFSSSVLLPVLETDSTPSRSISVTDERQHANLLTDLFDGVTYHKVKKGKSNEYF